MPGRKHKFPATKDYPAKDPFVLCPAERILKLYEEETGKKMKKMCKTVREWFEAKAHDEGWAACQFTPEVQSKHGAGCVLLNPPAVKVTVHQIVIQRD